MRRSLNPDDYRSEDVWNPGLVEDLYVNMGLPVNLILDLLGISEQTLYRWLEKHGIELRQPPGSNDSTTIGYPHLIVEDGDRTRVVLIHRLVAVAEYGFDGVADKHVHHKNGVKWDLRPENLEPVTPEEHNQIHAGGEPAATKREAFGSVELIGE